MALRISTGVIVWLVAACYHEGAGAQIAGGSPAMRTLRVALVQFDSVPEQPQRNLSEMERLARLAVNQGARLVMFHEGTLTDYTPRLDELAEPVPDGPACQRVASLAKQLGCFISFGLSERDGDRFYITQVFFGPEGLVHRYRKAWLWREEKDEGYRNEHARYDPGGGPERFTIDGIVATCFDLRRRRSALHPAGQGASAAVGLLPQQPRRAAGFPRLRRTGERDRAPMLVTNRVGKSWIHACRGGCVAFDARGNVLAKANREGREEVLVVDVAVPAAVQRVF